MAEACGLSGTMVVDRVAVMAERVTDALIAAGDEVRSMPAGGHPMLEPFQEAIEARCRTVTTNLAD